MPGTLKTEFITTANGSDLRQLEIQHNNVVNDVQIMDLALTTDSVWSWQTAAANSGQALGRGSTDTAIASGKFAFAIGGVPESKAAVTTGTAPTAQTVPAGLWALYSLDSVAGGTLSVAPAALNTTGYATEALAIAALPARITAKARLGYITVQAQSGNDWIGATDALAGGTTGNEAQTTNYYPYDGLFAPTGVAYGANGIVTASTANAGRAWTGGRNGIIVATTLAIGSTDTRISSTAFLYSSNGVTNINKAANTTGSAMGALGTIPAGMWGVIALYINSLGTQTFAMSPGSSTTGFTTEAAAIGDLSKMFPTYTASAQVTLMGYATVKAQSGNAWICGTDAMAGGTTGNEAAGTNYYPVAGITLLQGESASLIASAKGTVMSSAQY